jgi:hypothetical protein
MGEGGNVVYVYTTFTKYGKTGKNLIKKRLDKK